MTTKTVIGLLNETDPLAGLIEESIQYHPEISGMVPFNAGEDGRGMRSLPNVGAARSIRGLEYRTRVRTAMPVASFRDENVGTDPVASTFEKRTYSHYILEVRFHADRAVADAHEDGADAYLAVEASGQLEASFRRLATNFYYGNQAAPGDTLGNPGLKDSVDASMQLDAGGTDVDKGSSVWAVKWGVQDVIWGYGNGGELAVGDVRVETLYDGSSKPYDGYVQTLVAYPGLQVGAKHSVAQMYNVTQEAGKTCDDEKLADLMALFPAGVIPDCIFLTRRSLSDLRKSRTATNAVGNPAPTPTDYEGIPLVPTDSILNTEAIV